MPLWRPQSAAREGEPPARDLLWPLAPRPPPALLSLHKSFMMFLLTEKSTPPCSPPTIAACRGRCRPHRHERRLLQLPRGPASVGSGGSKRQQCADWTWDLRQRQRHGQRGGRRRPPGAPASDGAATGGEPRAALTPSTAPSISGGHYGCRETGRAPRVRRRPFPTAAAAATPQRRSRPSLPPTAATAPLARSPLRLVTAARGRRRRVHPASGPGEVQQLTGDSPSQIGRAHV